MRGILFERSVYLSITDQIERIRGNIAASYEALRAKGADIPAVQNSANLSAAVASVPVGISVETHLYSQINPAVEAFLSEVTYDPSDYSSSSISAYASASTSYNKSRPAGVAITVPEAGVLTITKGSRSLSYSVPAGSYTIYNISPGSTGSYFVRNSSDQIVAAGLLKPTGALRMIYVDNLVNMRDLGGWACDGGTVRYGRLFRGSELTGTALPSAQINSAGIEIMNDLLGIDYECDLRWNSETYGADGLPDTADDITSSALGDHVEYCRFPIQYYQGGVNLTGAYADVMKECLLFIMERVIRGDIGYFHCMYGRDRTGTLACILLALLGVSQSDIDKDYELTTFIGLESGLTAYRNSSGWRGLISYFNTFAGSTFRDKVANWAVQLGIPVSTINAFRTAMIDGSAQNLSPDVTEFSVTNALSHAVSDNAARTAIQYQPYRAAIAAEEGYLINAVTVEMEGTNITEECFSGEQVIRRWYVQANCDEHTNLTNHVRYVQQGGTFATFTTCETGYEVSNVSIMIGGENMSNYYANGAIIIPQVTGNVSITVTTEKVSRLPDAFKEVEYIENTGSAYCDLGFTGKTGLVARGKAQFYAGGDVYLLGCTNASSQRWALGTTAYVRQSSAQGISLAGSNVDVEFTFDTAVSGTGLELIFNGTAAHRAFSNTDSFDNGVTAALFCRHGSNGYERHITGRVYYLTVTDGGVEVIHLVPCKRKSDNIAGFFDTVSGNFFASISADAFAPGPEV